MFFSELYGVLMGSLDLFIIVSSVAMVILVLLYAKFKTGLVFRIGFSTTAFAWYGALAGSLATYADMKYNTIYYPLLGAFIIIAIIFVGLISIFLYKTIVLPINNLVTVSQKLAEGDLAQSFNQNNISNDEIGTLFSNFQRMQSSLNESISKINTVAESLTSSEIFS